MSQVELYPYPTAPDSLTLRWTAPDIDPEEGLGGTIEAQGLPEGSALQLGLEVGTRGRGLRRSCPMMRRSEPPTEVIVAVRSVSSRRRELVVLAEDDGEGARFTGKLDLTKADCFGEIELEPNLVRTRTGTADGYGQHSGARLAWGPRRRYSSTNPPFPQEVSST